MRNDMARILFQVPHDKFWQAPKAKSKHRRANRSQDVEALDDLCPHEGMRRYARGRTVKRNGILKPLENFLESRVGQSWAEVYAELCEHADSRTWLGRHLREWMRDLVFGWNRPREWVDGVLYETGKPALHRWKGGVMLALNEEGFIIKVDQEVQRTAWKTYMQQAREEIRNMYHPNLLSDS